LTSNSTSLIKNYEDPASGSQYASIGYSSSGDFKALTEYKRVQPCSHKLTQQIVVASPHAIQSQQAVQEHIPEGLLSMQALKLFLPDKISMMVIPRLCA